MLPASDRWASATALVPDPSQVGTWFPLPPRDGFQRIRGYGDGLPGDVLSNTENTTGRDDRLSNRLETRAAGGIGIAREGAAFVQVSPPFLANG